MVTPSPLYGCHDIIRKFVVRTTTQNLSEFNIDRADAIYINEYISVMMKRGELFLQIHITPRWEGSVAVISLVTVYAVSAFFLITKTVSLTEAQIGSKILTSISKIWKIYSLDEMSTVTNKKKFVVLSIKLWLSLTRIHRLSTLPSPGGPEGLISLRALGKPEKRGVWGKSRHKDSWVSRQFLFVCD